MTYQSSREILYYKVPVFTIELIVHLLILFLLIAYLPDAMFTGLRLSELQWGLYALLGMSFSLSIAIYKLRLHERNIKTIVVIMRSIVQTLTTYLFFTLLIAVLYKAVPRYLLFGGLSIALPALALCHYVANKSVRLFRRFGHNTRKVIIIGAHENSKRLYAELRIGSMFTGYDVLGFFTSYDNPDLPSGAKLLGKVEDFGRWITEKGNSADEVFCSLPPATCQKEVNAIINVCNDHFIDFNFVPTMDGYPKRQMAISQMGSVTLFRLREEPLNSIFARIIKRTIDIIISLIFLCTIYPFVLIFVWIGTTISSPGPLYFKQDRTGYNGKTFKIYKFRSMKVNADADKLQATKDDPRKTRFGNFLRSSSIDELPQFINVLKGDMSIIGPRPHMEYHTDVYSKLVEDYMVRHLAKPGITGWAQINGCRGETKTVEEMARRVEHDIWYVEHWTLLLDLEIFFRTIWQVFPGHDEQAY